MTSEAIEDFFSRTDGKRRRFFLVEGTTGHPVCALLLELHVVLHDPHYVSLALEVVEECLWIAHVAIIKGSERLLAG